MSTLLKVNMIDYPIEGGPIGDNCFYHPTNRVVLFTRNNVWIYVKRRQIDLVTAWEEIEHVARRIDRAIIEAPKVASGKQVPAPIIHSIKLIPPLPKAWGDRGTVKIEASDPFHDSLSFRRVGEGFGLVNDDGVKSILPDSLYSPVYWTDNPNKFKVMAWVWNEDNVIAFAEKVFAFDK
jgi:hypothetical protein